MVARARAVRRAGTAAAAAAPRARLPRVGTWTLAAIGAAAGLLYGIAVLRLSFGAPMVMLALGGLALALSGRALWYIIDPLARTEEADAAAVAPEERSRTRELEREKQLVLKAIKEVELDYQMKKIAEPDYREMSERYRARALRLLAEISAGDSYRDLIERELRDRLAVAAQTRTADAAIEAEAQAEAEAAVSPKPPADGGAAAAQTRACASCGAGNDSDAQFCKRCGTKL